MFTENANNYKKFKDSITESLNARVKGLEGSQEFKEHVYFDNIKEWYTDHPDQVGMQTPQDIKDMVSIVDFYNYMNVDAFVAAIDIRDGNYDNTEINFDNHEKGEEEVRADDGE